MAMGFPSGLAVENPPVMQETQETWIQYPSWEDSLEEEMAIHFNIPAWRVPWTGEPGGLHSPESCRESDTTEVI